MVRVLALAVWCYGVWVLVTWTMTADQLVFGAVVAVAVAACLSPLGGVAAPWRLMTPRRLIGLGRLIVLSLFHIVRANLQLAKTIWSPSRPLRSGMVVTRTEFRSEGGLAAVGIITSLIVDNQIVDIDRAHQLLQYHAVDVPPADAEAARRAINGPTEDLLRGVLDE